MVDLATALRWTTERYPHRRAIGGPAPLTYAEWDVRTEQVAHALHHLGAAEGSRAIFLLRGGEPLATLHMAAQKARVVSLPLSTRLSPDELAYCIDDCDPALIAVDESTHALVVAALRQTAAKSPPVVWAGEPEDAPLGTSSLHHTAAQAPTTRVPATPRGDDISVMLYTSGTTGRPKGVPRTHRAEHYAAVAHLIQTGHAPGEVALGVMPLFHTMGLRTLLASVVAAGTWVPQAKFEAESSLDLITSEGVSALYLVPTIFWSLLETGRLEEATSVRRLAYAGASMTPTLAQKLADVVQPERFVNHFGSTEIYTFTIGPDAANKPGCAGRAGVFSEVRLVHPDPSASPEQTVAPGQQGQVVVSMQSLEAFGGYWHRPDADRSAIREGWYFTGDLATADEEGDLWVSGRVDDMINSGGENIYPEEIENALANSPDVREVVVVGTPDDKWGHAVTAFLVGAPDDSPSQTIEKIERFSRDESGLPSMKRPKRFVVVDQIPKSAVGKILRRRLTDGDFVRLADSGEETP
ncbi:AMP-dependent synthetase/ligase [Nocardioides sp. PD653-B2]|nr:AMP-dependent synthetase/ligase [Nocardioides sp. PD653-B2]